MSSTSTTHLQKKRLWSFGRAKKWLQESLRLVLTIGKTILTNSAIFIIIYGPKELFLRFYQRKKARGEPLFVEDIPGACKLTAGETQAHSSKPVPSPPALFKYPFKARFMRLSSYPRPTFTLQYRKPPLSGRILSGVNETVPRRVKKFFHAGYSTPYGAINLAFHMVVTKESLRRVLKAMWDNRHSKGPVAILRSPVDDPGAMAAELKAKARVFGAPLAGCTQVTDEALYEGCDTVLPHAIVLAAPMDRERMLQTPSLASGVAIIDGYIDVGRAAIELAKYIRGMGWNAEADTNLGNVASKVLHIPLAINAGLGQMGRHTSLITKEFGANVRLATVLTDIPMTFDRPVDIGVEEVCANCRVCAENCPPQAIYEKKSHGERS